MYYYEWPYPIEYDQEERIEGDVIVLGGGISGCMAAISAAKAGKKVILIEKGTIKRSGAGGSGCDHWESAATNPCSKVTPEELTQAMIDDNDGYNNGISHYIECREGYDTLLEIEKMGGKIRDTEGEFKGSDFRDDETGLMFAYDYENKFTVRIWGTTFKPAMYNELKRLGVKIVERTMATSLLTEDGKIGSKIIGATGINTRTGKFYVFNAKATIISMSRPARIWLFSSSYPGLSEFRPTQCIGDGHAMGWMAGAEFNMMEKSVRAEFSAAGKSFPPYGAGNNHNTWYPASIIDSTGKEVPYLDRDGNILQNTESRFKPSENQKFFMMGGNIDNPKYDYEGPEIEDITESDEEYQLPLYADLSNLPEMERKVIWGMMVGEEGKTKVPIYDNYMKKGFDPSKHVLQCYGSGWKSASFNPDERQLFGLPGGFMNDWRLGSNLEGLFISGDALFSSNCYGHAATTGSYAGRHASEYSDGVELIEPDARQIQNEKDRVYKPLSNDPKNGIDWRELNMAIAKNMRIYCGEIKRNDLLHTGLKKMKEYEENILDITYASNPHELTRLLEVHNILSVAQLILNACIIRNESSNQLNFYKHGSDEEKEGKFIVIKKDEQGISYREESLDYYGDFNENYSKFNNEYLRRKNEEQ